MTQTHGRTDTQRQSRNLLKFIDNMFIRKHRHGRSKARLRKKEGGVWCTFQIHHEQYNVRE